MQILNEIRSFTKLSVERKVFMLSERAFQAHFMREEGFSAAEAKARWEADKADKSVYRMDEGGRDLEVGSPGAYDLCP